MNQKKCFKCDVKKPIDQFYKHGAMLDGHLNKCKECTKADVRRHRRENDSVRAYDRSRGSRMSQDACAKYRKENPIKCKAHNLVNNSIRDGKLKRKPCEICGADKAHAHHDDYSRPLDVRWLCPLHHQRWHAEHGEAKLPTLEADSAIN